MSTKSLKLRVSPQIGEVSAKYTTPEKPVCILTLAHGAGAGMDHAFMETLAASLADAGIATLRFNFPFAEQKKFRPDTPAVAHQVIAAAIAKARDLQPKLPLFVSGKSFGGRMSSQYLSEHPESPVKGVIFYGFPLHPSGKPATDRAEHLGKIKVPMLFLQGSKDTLATWDLIEKVCSTLPKATLVKLEGADHSFKAGKKDTMSVLVEETKNWIEKTIH
ncbi:alpha/beta fold hydrolase [Chitinophaga sp. GCM10012297]|uniref:Alpha/beta fold hydrolase n=1 Tax=Chitinophaga chungangae TaxID=2821488 RepID=A0ABS3YFB0_9BACT|nr:alpha/beta fold hydrolase [Chitinophaga chungangae]MBO9153358.1 alpha/beta fold hydrolase [Chitinophaga chungangae]